MSELLNRFILWKPLKFASIALYAAVVALAPFNQFWSVVILFFLICLWSRVPCLISMFTKDFDVVDFFVVNLAIHVSGPFGGFFGLIIMLFSRIFGPNEWWLYTVKDGAAMMICGFLTPMFYAVFGTPLATLYAFTITRWTLYMIFTVLFEPEALGLELGLGTIGTIKSYIYNTFVMKTFEKHLLKVFEGGIHFSFGLLVVATGIMAAFYGLSRLSHPLEQWWRNFKKNSQAKYKRCPIDHDCLHQF